MVLLVVDVQEAIVNESLYQCRTFLEDIRRLLAAARTAGVEVLYVVHDDGADSDLTPGKPGFSIYHSVFPQREEKVFVKTVNSAFKGTGLADYLRSAGQKDVVVVGLQTDKCLNATIVCGFEHGFRMIVPKQANTTVDNSYLSAAESWRYYNDFMWPGRYACCRTVEEVLSAIAAQKGTVCRKGE